MSILIERANDLELLSAFLADINNQKSNHIGFCGTDRAGILTALKEDCVDENGDTSFFIAKNNTGEIIAACGLDVDNEEAEVWGPFNKTESMEISAKLWGRLKENYPAVQQFSFLINEKNIKQQLFMKQINAEEEGQHLSLIIHRSRFGMLEEIKSSSIKEEDFPVFQALHDFTFPGTYYDAETIRSRLNEGNILKVLKDDHGGLIGYAYFEIDKELSEASLEYFAVSNNYQNKGFGGLLLKEALTAMFSYPEIREIYLTVDAGNHHANHVYEKVGFEKGNTLIHYKRKE
ncbi:GNAT family N-acetyltransferase [Oceanobacillus neutriphilus]|uniref:N-acetyltransferase n=1 Tax=Oceanobacillus neutriphilus TaxID=531815 RepID=A0ABQ2NW40_9BACI|nr:GNAT family N-acetyltransferase [Oceanobacillus neutriphilus]GGP11979.1 N-acetyltransferase [Oceanobacillus neutriphilus]